jgi:hypothetical protein
VRESDSENEREERREERIFSILPLPLLSLAFFLIFPSYLSLLSLALEFLTR